MPAGTLARVPPDVVHGFRNASDADVRYLNLHAPGREFANFMRALRDGRTPPELLRPAPAAGRRRAADDGGGRRRQARSSTDEPGLRVTLHADIAAIRVAEVRCDPGHRARRRTRDADHVAVALRARGRAGADDRRSRAARAGRLVAAAAAGVPYAVAAAGTEPLRYLDLRTPAP